MAILDTNVLIRYFTEDDKEQSERAIALIEDVEARRRSVTLTEAVLTETIRILSTHWMYNIDRETIRTRVVALLRLRHLSIPNKRLYFEALDLYVEYSRLSFVDALCVAYGRRSPDKTVISFDRDFRSLPDLVWEQP